MSGERQLTLALASGSPRRRELLERMGARFDVFPAQVDEFDDPDAEPTALVHHNCRIKAEWAAEHLPEQPVLAADTTVCLNSRVLNKPADLAEAREMLLRLSGREHTVYTGVCLIFAQRGVDEAMAVSSKVRFQRLDNERIDRYFEIVNPLDKAGAYGIQEGRELIIDSYEGSFTNIMGLPVEETQALLTKVGLWSEIRQIRQ